MPTVTLNRDVFERLVGKKLSDEQLKDRISMLGTALEGLYTKEIIVEIFPNRPDMLSEQGFARAFAAFIGTKQGFREYKIKKSGSKVIVDKNVTMRPFTVCALVKNLTFTDERIREIMQIQEKLAATHGRNRKKSAYGIYPADNINFPAIYTAKDPAQVTFWPMGMPGPIKASQVEQLHPKGREYKHIAEGWKKYPFFIDAKNNVMCMLPYTNSNDTGKVETTTKNVFVECTGTDLNNVTVALNIIVTMLADMGGEIYSIDMVYPDKTITTPDLSARTMNLNISEVNRILGLTLTEKEVRLYLERMGYGTTNRTVLVPAYRADILHPIDLVEDIAIAYGYENVKEEIPHVATIAEEAPLSRFVARLSELLIGAGQQEVKSYHLLSQEELGQKMKNVSPSIPLKNAPADYDRLRNRILPGLIKILAQNQHHNYPQCIFEVGVTFNPDSKAENGVREQMTMGVMLCHEKADVTSIRQIIDLLGRALALPIAIRETTNPSFIEGRTAEAVVNGKIIAIFGEIHPQVLANWNMVMPVAAAEIDVEALFAIVQQNEEIGAK